MGHRGGHTGEQAWGTGQGAQVRHIGGAHRHLNSGGDAAGDGVGVGMLRGTVLGHRAGLEVGMG